MQTSHRAKRSQPASKSPSRESDPEPISTIKLRTYSSACSAGRPANTNRRASAAVWWPTGPIRGAWPESAVMGSVYRKQAAGSRRRAVGSGKWSVGSGQYGSIGIADPCIMWFILGKDALRWTRGRHLPFFEEYNADGRASLTRQSYVEGG